MVSTPVQLMRSQVMMFFLQDIYAQYIYIFIIIFSDDVDTYYQVMYIYILRYVYHLQCYIFFRFFRFGGRRKDFSRPTCVLRILFESPTRSLEELPGWRP